MNDNNLSFDKWTPDMLNQNFAAASDDKEYMDRFNAIKQLALYEQWLSTNDKDKYEAFQQRLLDEINKNKSLADAKTQKNSENHDQILSDIQQKVTEMYTDRKKKEEYKKKTEELRKQVDELEKKNAEKLKYKNRYRNLLLYLVCLIFLILYAALKVFEDGVYDSGKIKTFAAMVFFMVSYYTYSSFDTISVFFKKRPK